MPKAFDALERAIENGSYQAALALIRLAGLDGVADKIGPDDAEEIIKKKNQEEMWADMFG